MGLPRKQGLYDPRNEHDACGVGFVASIKGRKTHDIVEQGLQILINLNHRGAVQFRLSACTVEGVSDPKDADCGPKLHSDF